MKWLLTHRAWQDYQDAGASVQKAFDKQVGLLAENLRHPRFGPRNTIRPMIFGKLE
jgi:hypothetical protein